MENRPVPYSWEGRQVIASIVEAGGYDPSNGIPFPLTAPEYTGTLEEVSELGILASLVDEPKDEVVSKFYPWSAVLYLRPQD